MTDPADPRFAQFTQAREFLQQRLGREIWSERQAYPAMKWALSFIAGVQPNPPNPAFDINQFVTEAVGQQADYSAAVREAENAQNEFDLMTKRYEFPIFFGSIDAGYLCCSQNITFLDLIFFDLRNYFFI